MAGPESIHRGGDQGQPLEKRSRSRSRTASILQHLMVSRRVSIGYLWLTLFPATARRLRERKGILEGMGRGGGRSLITRGWGEGGSLALVEVVRWIEGGGGLGLGVQTY